MALSARAAKAQPAEICAGQSMHETSFRTCTCAQYLQKLFVTDAKAVYIPVTTQYNEYTEKC